VRGFVIFVGLLLMLGGGAVAGAQFAPIDLSTLSALDSLPGSREFLKEQMALYAGGGAAGFGLLLVIITAATGGKKKVRPAVKPPSLAPETTRPGKATPVDSPLVPPVQMPPSAPTPKPAPRSEPAPAVQKAAAPQPVAASAPQPVAAATPPAAKPVISPAPALAPVPDMAKAKPQASSQPPASAAQPAASSAPPPDHRMVNRKRLQDLVTINDALKAFHMKNGAYPKSDGLAGANERGAGWIPGLSPEFLAQVPLDPLHSADTQYVYASDGANYKLLAQGVSLVGSGNVEVLGIKIDQTRNPTPQNAAFGFWTPAFAGV
jgi:outer membrane biosynthesis protein TonB